MFELRHALRSGRWLSVVLVAIAVTVVCGSHSSAASAEPGFGLSSFQALIEDEDGVPYPTAQAGSHPFSAAARMTFNHTITGTAPVTGADLRRTVENVRSITTDLPVGFYGDPQSFPTCGQEQLVNRKCPVESQVGVVDVDLNIDASAATNRGGVYNIAPDDGAAAMFGFTLSGIGNVYLPASVRSDSDYGVTVTAPNVSGDPDVFAVDLELWGVPADPRHDVDREDCTGGFSCTFGMSTTAPRRPFLSNPSVCKAEHDVTRVTIDSWQRPRQFVSYTDPAPLVTGCGALSFEPQAVITPTELTPDTPTGLGVDLAFPVSDDPDGLSTPPLKRAVVTLPEGMTINPAAAGGLEACSDVDLRLKSKAPVTCPNTSKIGTVTAKSPVLEETLTGGVYIRSQNSGDPESGEMFRLALVLENEERGLSFRLPGEVRVDEDTGRIETTFDNNPQLPVESIKLTLKQGARAPLATPPTCGRKAIETELTSWGGQTVSRTSTFDVKCVGGLGDFAPSFAAGAVNPVAGTFSPFVVEIAKRDGDSVIDGVSLKMPTGLLARVAGNLNTQVGSVRAFAGPGSQPYVLPGTVTLEGAYGDAPYSLRVVVPAKAGPFDLGDVTVRQKIYIDSVTAEVTVVSDPVPTIVKGVPARLQRLEVNVDKPGFMINPTSCAKKEITGTLKALGGQTAAVQARFQVGECASLPFKPKLAMRLTGKRQVTTGKHPGVKAQVDQTGVGEAGIDKAVVRLPKSLALDPENAQALCEFEDGTKPDLEKHCPAGSIVGRARAKTPLLERDLVGNVYFVKNVRKDPTTGNLIRTLPMIVVALRGEIAINLKGESSTTKGGKLVNTFNNVPDAPITQFNLNIKGGQNGILAVTRTRKAKINLCAGRHVAEADMDGQNGKRYDRDIQMKTPCTKRQTKAAKRKAKRAAAKARH